MRRKPLDLGHIDWDINGLFGLDILLPGRFVIDLDALEIYPEWNGKYGCGK